VLEEVVVLPALLAVKSKAAQTPTPFIERRNTAVFSFSSILLFSFLFLLLMQCLALLLKLLHTGAIIEIC